MTRSRVAWPVAAALLLAVAAATGCVAAKEQTVTIAIHYSAFDPPALSVPAGVPITFVLVNEDPIDHEWLIGDEAFHARHRAGTEAVHGDRPNEISLPPFSVKTTTLTFICHFPQHEAYGMVGVVMVKP